jgi:sugar O-acyltransferase (sialic acid O-acetyltransferase NeuD family)
MLVLGSGGFAMQILDVLSENSSCDFSKLSFYNDTGKVSNAYIHEHFKIISDKENYFSENESLAFILGTGTPAFRKSLYHLFSNHGQSRAVQVISNHAVISAINVKLGEAVCIMPGAIVMGNSEIALGSLINCNTSIGHDSFLGEFVEVCPGVVIAGNCTIGSETFIGSGAVIFPGVQIGENCVIGAGAIVTKNVPANHKVIGNPGIATKR